MNLAKKQGGEVKQTAMDIFAWSFIAELWRASYDVHPMVRLDTN